MIDDPTLYSPKRFRFAYADALAVRTEPAVCVCGAMIEVPILAHAFAHAFGCPGAPRTVTEILGPGPYGIVS